MANMAEYTGFWVFAEQINGKIADVGRELLGKARQLADEKGVHTAAVVIGDFEESQVKDLISYGADKVYLLSHPNLKLYSSLTYTRLLEELVNRERPEAFLFGAGPLGADLAPRVAARLNTGLSAHCVDLRLNKEGGLDQVVPGFGGSLMATIVCPNHRPQMATVMPGAMKMPEPQERDGEVVVVDMGDVAPSCPEIVEFKPKERSAVALDGADVVIAGGWGMGSKDNWELLEELAGVLGGAVGATRPAIDEGWAPEEVMIGQSGKTVHPKLYIGAGVSGVMHHVVGIQDADVIVAINKDPKAQIFEVCDFGIVGDATKVLPVLISELRERLGGEGD
jgi:electron transfer flavoprotein alpha subunit